MNEFLYFPVLVVEWLLSWTLYWLGHIVSKPMNWSDSCAYMLYMVYHNLMTWSYNVQEFCGFSGHPKFPWSGSGTCKEDCDSCF